jgi:predicted nucleic acid-binding Zn ribbon protein
MAGYREIFFLVVRGIMRLWVGYTLFFDTRKGGKSRGPGGRGKNPRERSRLFRAGPGERGGGQSCPVCSALLREGELVSSSAFPSLNSQDRLMHIRGCVYCLSGERERYCPVCGAELSMEEILVARLFERPYRRPHVHVLGCSRCRKAVR